MSKEKSFSGIYKDVTYEDILSYKRYPKIRKQSQWQSQLQ